jgi:hypothetical protein
MITDPNTGHILKTAVVLDLSLQMILTEASRGCSTPSETDLRGVLPPIQALLDKQPGHTP